MFFSMPEKRKKVFSEFRDRLVEMSHLKAALSVLHWDMEVYMPEKGGGPRAEALAHLSGELHEKFLSEKFVSLLKKAKEEMDAGALAAEEVAVVREVWREFEIEKKLPLDFVKEMAKVTSEAHNIWREAREKSDFKIFLPQLKKIVELKRREASLIGFKNSPYDALLDLYEPGAKTDEIAVTFEELKKFLIPFIERIKGSSAAVDPGVLSGDFDIGKQKTIGELIAKKIGFDFSAGRMDVSTHPFSTSHHPYDVRITTRFDKNNLFYSVGSTTHEVGHALYEQGLPAENFGTPLAESISLGIHESQSMVWENMVGKSRAFWKYFYPLLQKEFPETFSSLPLEDFYRALNYVNPSFIRTEADEVTYNLHIILRFEIEKALIEGALEAGDLPQIWNAKMKEFLGVDVPGDAMGVLQDVHWSGGSMGYFPTYALGNLYSAQFYNAAKRDVLNLEEEISSGEFGHFRKWLKDNIHIHGKLYSASELVRRVSGEDLTSKHFIDYLERKYSEIYGL